MTYPMLASTGRVLLWGAAFVVLWAAPAHAADFSGPVVSPRRGHRRSPAQHPRWAYSPQRYRLRHH